MGKLWVWVMAFSMTWALVNGRAGETAAAFVDAGGSAIALTVTLAGSMSVWSGVMAVLEESGILRKVARLFRWVTRPLYPGLTDESCWNALSMNCAANMMGLGNAATPAGIEAARRLTALGSPGRQGLMTLLVMNSASLQLIPTTVMALRQSAGSADPGAIWIPTLLTSMVSMATGLFLLQLIRRKVEA